MPWRRRLSSGGNLCGAREAAEILESNRRALAHLQLNANIIASMRLVIKLAGRSRDARRRPTGVGARRRRRTASKLERSRRRIYFLHFIVSTLRHKNHNLPAR